MKKIIGWFKNVLMRILEVVNYMVKKDNEIELAKLEVKREIAKDVFEAVSDTLSNKKVQIAIACATVGVLFTSSNMLTNRKAQFVLGCTVLSLGVGLGCGLLYISNHDFNTPSN